jgi:hypothetical protein
MELEPNTGVVDSRNVFGILHNAVSRNETYAWDKAPSAYQRQPGVVQSNMRLVHNQTSIVQRVQPALTEVAEQALCKHQCH